MPSNLYDLTLHEARQLLDSRQVSSQELTQAILDRVQRVEPRGRRGAALDPLPADVAPRLPPSMHPPLDGTAVYA